MAERLKKILPPGIADDDDLTPEEEQAIQQQRDQQAQVQAKALELQFGEQQAKIENTQADTANKQAQAVNRFSDTEQNDVENDVQLAELAQASRNPELLQQALIQVVNLIQNVNQPQAGVQ